MYAVAIYNVKWNHGSETSRKLVKVFKDSREEAFTPLNRAKLELSQIHGEFIGDTFIDSTYLSDDRTFVSIPMCSDRCLRTEIVDVFIGNDGKPRRMRQNKNG